MKELDWGKTSQHGKLTINDDDDDDDYTCNTKCSLCVLKCTVTAVLYVFLKQVEDLRLGLVEAGRNDLAEELSMKNKEYRREVDKKHEGILATQTCTTVCRVLS